MPPTISHVFEPSGSFYFYTSYYVFACFFCFVVCFYLSPSLSPSDSSLPLSLSVSVSAGVVFGSLAAGSPAHLFSIFQSIPLFNPVYTSTPRQIIQSVFVVIVANFPHVVNWVLYKSSMIIPTIIFLLFSCSGPARAATTLPDSLPHSYQPLSRHHSTSFK